MKFSELTSKSVTELQRQLSELREQLRDRRFRVAHGQTKDVRELRELKRDISRLLTRIRQTTAKTL